MRTAIVSLLLVLSLLALPSCATCREDAHRNDLACWAQGAVISCAGDSVVPEVLPLLLQLVAAVTAPDGAVNWATVEGTLVGMGVRDGGCLLAALKDKLDGLKTSASSPAARRAWADAAADAAATLASRWPGKRFDLGGGRVVP